MASDFDSLLAELQHDLALAGDIGLSYTDVETKTNEYYEKKNAAVQIPAQVSSIDLLFSTEPPASRTVVTRQIIESAWQSLNNLKDIQTRHDAATSGDSPHPGQRLVATIEQLWLAVAGHSVDITRIKGLEFPLLHLIAKHGPAGIPQPELVKLSGQDKRSVPQRTDRLAKNGYIVKIPVIVNAAKTSLLKLKRFVEVVEDPADEESIPAHESVIYYEKWFDGVMRLLKKHNNVMAVDDLRVELGIVKSEWQSRAFQRCIRRLVASGCCRRIKARVSGKLDGDYGLYARALQLLREPTAADKDMWMTKPKDHSLRSKLSLLNQQDKPEDADEQDEDDEEDEDDLDVVDTVELTDLASTEVPQWTPDLPLPRFLFELIDRAGPEGISIMSLHKQGIGQLFRRPMDDELLRMCDYWQTSQPPHLAHLTIVKDTGAVDKFTFFKYRSHRHFQTAVENGDAFWESVIGKADDQKKKKGKKDQRALQILDTHGFPVPEKSKLAGRRDGTATLAQAVKSATSMFAHKKGNLWVLYGHRRNYGKPSGTPKKRSASDLDFTPDQRPSKLSRGKSPLDVDDHMMEATSTTEETPVAGDGGHSAVHVDTSESPAASLGPPGEESFVIRGGVGLASNEQLASINAPRAVSLRALAWPARKGRKPKSMLLTVRTQRLFELSWYVASSSQASRTRQAYGNVSGLTARPVDATMIYDQADDFVIKPSSAMASPSPQLQDGATLRSMPNGPVAAGTASAVHDHDIADASIIDTTPQKGRKKPGLARAQGAVQIKRTQVLLDILRQCGGIYPGDREIHTPMVIAIKRLHGSVCDGATIDKCIKELLYRNKLRKLVFQFHDAKGVQITKHILTDLSIQPTDPRIKTLQQNMQNAHPGRYQPPEMQSMIDDALLDLGLNTKSQPSPLRVASTQNKNTGAETNNEPMQFEVVVERTVAGLELEEDTRAELALKNAREGKAPRRRRKKSLASPEPEKSVEPATASSDDGDAEDEEPIDEEQVKFSNDFQAARYVHDHKHALAARKPEAPLDNCTDIATFFGLTKARIPNVDFGPTRLARSRALMMMPIQTAHEASGTVSTMATVSVSLEETTIKELEQEKKPRKAPVARLQSLGSSLFNNRRFIAKAPMLQITNRDKLAELESARARALGIDSTKSTARDDDESDEEFVVDEAPKTKPKRAYKSLRGAKSSHGVARKERPKGGIEILELDDPRLQGPSYAITRKRDRKTPQQFKESNRLTGAVALYRVVMGAMDQRNNWGIISHMFSFRYEPDFLRRRWDLIKNGREETIRKIMERLYDLFLNAYEKGIVPAIDFDHLNRVDWPALLQWFESNNQVVNISRQAGVPELPRRMDEFSSHFEVTDTPMFWEYSREAWFTTPVEKTRRDLAHEFVYGTPLPGQQRPTNSFTDDRLVLRSLIRAISVTREDNYDASEAAALLEPWSDEVVAATCEEMLSNKTIRHLNKGRQRPGRNYEIHDAHWALFRRWPGKVNEWQYVRDLASARHDILGRFEKSDRVFLDFHASDAEIVIFTNLVDQGLVRIVTDLPERNDDFEAPYPKISALGYSDYTYNAKTLDRERLRFPVVYERTSRYHSSHGLVEGVPIPTAARIDDGRVPFWVDIQGNPLPDVWDLVARSILQILVYRTGCSTMMMEECHNHRFMEWEIDLVVEWMEQSGIAVRCAPGIEVDGIWRGGWRAGEWWYCAFEPEMAYWKSN